MIIGGKVNSRRYADILGVILALAVLCVAAGAKMPELPSVRGVSGNWAVSDNIAGESDLIPGASVGNELKKIPGILTEAGIRQKILAPDMKLEAFAVPDAGFQWESKEAEEPLAGIQEPPAGMPEEPDVILDQPAAAPEIPEESSEETGGSAEGFLCGGLVCDSMGMVTGCTDDMVITDGVLCLPSDSRCTGIRAGAFSQLGLQVWEVYIPANIISIEDGAFDGLDPSLYIQMHPDNPAYGSSEGSLYEK